MYKLNSGFGTLPVNVQRLSDNAFIPFDPANTDYQQFKKDVLQGSPDGSTEGAELQDADGNVMTQEEAVAFINELP
jgi:hypothetical protein